MKAQYLHSGDMLSKISNFFLEGIDCIVKNLRLHQPAIKPLKDPSDFAPQCQSVENKICIDASRCLNAVLCC